VCGCSATEIGRREGLRIFVLGNLFALSPHSNPGCTRLRSAARRIHAKGEMNYKRLYILIFPKTSPLWHCLTEYYPLIQKGLSLLLKLVTSRKEEEHKGNAMLSYYFLDVGQ
jgi:hypothetical protein